MLYKAGGDFCIFENDNEDNEELYSLDETSVRKEMDAKDYEFIEKDVINEDLVKLFKNIKC